MKLLLIIFILTSNVFANEVRLTLEKSPILTGELVRARVENYSGERIEEKTMGDNELYVFSMENSAAEIVFLKKPSTQYITLESGDKLTWNPVEVIEVQEPENLILSEQLFSLRKNYLALYIFLILILVSSGCWFYLSKIKPKIQAQKEKRKIKDSLLSAQDFNQVIIVWKEKHLYLDIFPFIEEDFNKWEAVFYKYAFKPDISDVDKKEVERSYAQFVDSIRGGPFGV